MDILNLFCFSFIFIWIGTSADDLPTCQPSDFHYEYTECDSEGGRWRVSVPRPNTCVGGAPNPPIRGKGCEFTCDAGQYIDIQNDQECHPCPAGTYSLGGGVRFEDWEQIPKGFSIQTETFSDPGKGFEEDNSRDVNCTKTGWIPKGSYIASLADECSASLVYSATLVKSGFVRFTYQYTDDDAIFHFVVQNDQCQTVGDKDSNKWPSMTDEGEWKTITVPLKSGLNVLYWKTLGVGGAKSKMKKPIMIQSVELNGVAFTSECTKCRAGSHSEAGSSSCTDCPKNTFSQRGAATCSPCDPTTEYAEPGAFECESRKPCTVDDYFEYNTPCDKSNMTTRKFKAVEPQICRTDLDGAVPLPTSDVQEKCPPCNPGMELKNGTCSFCPPGTFSDGSTPCQTCAPSTAPEIGLTYKWWNSLPSEANVTTSCLSMNDKGCQGTGGWQTAMDHIHTEKSHSEDAYLVLSLHLGGFKGTEQVIHGKPVTIAEISFIFELDCTKNCQFFFMQQSSSRGTSVVQEWPHGNNGKMSSKQKFTYNITKTEPITFSWAFQKVGWSEDEDGGSKAKRASGSSYATKNDMAKIYSIEVTNTLEGGAQKCKSCPRGASVAGCIPCKPGHYIDANTTRCMPCPHNTIVRGDNPWGKESCMSCGNGLVAAKSQRCETSCHFKDSNGMDYDFTKLSGMHSTTGARLFTSSGTQYYHYFNISLCGNGNTIPMALCKDNISYVAGEDEENVQAMICRTTIIPPRPNEDATDMAAQPVSLGDILINITDGKTFDLREKMKNEGFQSEEDDIDVHFFYMSEEPTSACKEGRTTIITLRCDITQKGEGVIELSPKCPDGTCDGCNFHLLWRSRLACPVCKKADYTIVKGECIGGEQTIHYYPPKHCLLTKPATSRKQKCSVLPFWLLITIGAILGFGIILCILLIYCWKRNKKLEYKYMKLVANSSNKDGELPAAETCALSEGEEDEQFDAVQFKENKGSNFFSKIKAMGVSKKDDNPFQTIELSDKMPLT